MKYQRATCCFYLALVLLSSSCIRVFSLQQHQSTAERADQLAASGQWEEAIELYQTHMQERLTSKSRPDEENPYFYHLLIGDLYLDQDKEKKALENYKIAEKENVASVLVVDRYRRLARWYSSRKDHERAISFLRSVRQLDPLIFDADIDLIHKKMVADEIDEENQ